jgi:hypothetical protein
MADETIIEFVLAAWIEALDVCEAVDAKVYPWGKAPQKTATKPFVLYHRIHGRRIRSLEGPSGTSAPLIQLDVIGRDYLVVRRLTADIREALELLAHGYDMGGRRVQVAVADDERDADDDDVRPHHGDELTEHRATIELEIWFQEVS